jgi:2-oxoglutarate dehydrogenase E1 component
MGRDLLSLGSSLGLIDEMYALYEEDQEAVDRSWRELFSNGAALPAEVAELPAQDPVNGRAPRRRRSTDAVYVRGRPKPLDTEPDAALLRRHDPSYVRDPGAARAGSVWPLVNAYRVRGHFAAKLDPLGLIQRPPTIELDPATYGFTDADLDREYPTGGLYGLERGTLRDIVAKLRSIYCGHIGLEFMHISTPVKKAWLAERMETRDQWGQLSPKARVQLLDRAAAAETFEQFVHRKYPGTKRFSLEGSEGMIPLLDEVLRNAVRLGAFEAVIGMAHRGRLAVLQNIMRRRARDIFAEFEDVEPEAALGGGDVKYHLGYSSDREFEDRHIHVSLTFNPSHLEAVDPVVVGRVRAKQRRHDDWEHSLVCGVLVHGDAAFAGQGLVAETLQLSNLHGFRTGGTVHIIVNNQIGFTASPQESRSTPYCTDIAKMIQCPIFHVNGEDLDAVAQTVQMAMEYRAQFQSDVVIDMFCYRKFGHNEMDEPSFTQPLMYERIQQKQSVVELYGKKLADEGVISEGEIERICAGHRDFLEAELAAARKHDKRPVVPSMGGVWSPYRGGSEDGVPDVDTGVPLEHLQEIAGRITRVPEGVSAHPKVVRLLDQRAQMGRGERPLDWGMSEMLAYGSLLWAGHNVRLTGQDSCRGTFSHRHALITDIKTGVEHMLLGQLHPDQGECRIYDSPLSEAGVLGFEFGYSLDYPDALVIWEAQFGDFANGAQVIIDQFIVSSEDKWNRLSGLTMFLPHGYEGQGPEHSSTRPERFLQQCAEDNMQVCQPSTPAQMFHMLRRQVVRPWRKPLVVLTPKSLLRHPMAMSSVHELTEGQFQRVLPDTELQADKVERVMLCSGRIYYDLLKERQRLEDERTAIVRIEQFYPWKGDRLMAALAGYRDPHEVVWVQDEPANMGAASFLEPRLRELFGAERLRFVCREASASPATGSGKAHAIEQRNLLDEAFGGAG